MKAVLSLLLLCESTFALLSERQKESLINIHSNFDKVSKVCNVYDEASYCQQIVVDHRVSLVAVSFKCECPKGWFCPSDPSETPAFTECQYVDSKFWRKCQLRCTPDHRTTDTSLTSSDSSGSQESL